MIAEVGAWKNMLDPDPEKRRQNMDYVTEKLAVAELLGARNCVDIAGSYDPNLWYAQNPRNLSQEFIDATVENCRKLIDAVKPTRTCFSIEMMPWSFPTGPDEYVRLVKAVDRKAFGVHLDVCNTMNSPVRLYNNSAGIRECFAKLGPWIKSCHAKDLKWGPGVQVWIQEVIPGTGLIDYKTLLQELSQLGTEAPLMLEHLHSEAEYTQGRQYIQGVARSLGSLLWRVILNCHFSCDLYGFGFWRKEPQVPPLRCAPVGMTTRLCELAFAAVNGSCTKFDNATELDRKFGRSVVEGPAVTFPI